MGNRKFRFSEYLCKVFSLYDGNFFFYIHVIFLIWFKESVKSWFKESVKLENSGQAVYAL